MVRAAGPDEAPEHGEDAEARRGAPDPEEEVGCREILRRRIRLEQRERGPADRAPEQDEPGAQYGCQEERPAERRPDLGLVAGARGLGREPCRPHPEEAEAPVEEIEDEHAKRDRAEFPGGARIPDDGRVNEPEKRHGRIREDDGPRERGDLPARGRKAPGPVRSGRHAGDDRLSAAIPAGPRGDGWRCPGRGGATHAAPAARPR